MSSYSTILYYRNVKIIVEDGLYKIHGDQQWFLDMTNVMQHIDKQFNDNTEEILKRIARSSQRDCTGEDEKHNE